MTEQRQREGASKSEHGHDGERSGKRDSKHGREGKVVWARMSVREQDSRNGYSSSLQGNWERRKGWMKAYAMQDTASF